MKIALANAAVATAAAVVVALLARALHRPALAHALWLLVLLKLLMPPMLRVPLPEWPAAWRERPLVDDRRSLSAEVHLDTGARLRPAATKDLLVEDTGSSAVTAQVGALRPALGSTADLEKSGGVLGLSVFRILGFVWMSGSVTCALIVAARVAKFRRLVRLASPAPPAMQARTSQLAGRLGLGRVPCVYLLPGLACPMLWAGFGRPNLLLPTALWDQFDEAQRDAVLLHELAHVKRRDHWVRWLETAATALHWWNPICWWARHELREAEEQCCDAWVMRALPGSFRPYADALLATADFVSACPAPMLASGLGQFTHLKRRLTLLKQGGAAHALGLPGLCGAAAFAALLLPMLPLPGRTEARQKTAVDFKSQTARIENPPSAPAESRSDQTYKGRTTATDTPVSPSDQERRLRELDQMESEAQVMLDELRAIRRLRAGSPATSDGKTDIIQRR